MNRCKHSELSLEMLNNNLKAIQMFVEEKNVTESRMREVFKDNVLPADYKPEKWNNYLSRWFLCLDHSLSFYNILALLIFILDKQTLPLLS